MSPSFKKIKIFTIVGTRPEIIRLSRIISKLDESPAINHILVHTGQNYDYELNQIFFDDLGIRKPDYFLNCAGATPSETIGYIFIKVDELLLQEKPDGILILGDTNSCLCAIPAKKHHIPIFHMEAGNRCFDQRVPEEVNRKIIDHISDINLTYSSIARENLIREGISSDRVIKTGSPIYEVLQHYLPRISSSSILEKLSLQKSQYFLISAHREENINDSRNFPNFLAVLNKLCEIYQFPIIVSTHPRTRKRLESYLSSGSADTFMNPLIQWQKPLSFSDYNALQVNAYAVLSDSGTISEESSILNFRALNIRETHERHEAMEEASVMMVGLNPERILQGLAQVQFQNTDIDRSFRLVYDYSMPNVSDKVVRIIVSYIDYIRRVVWNEID